MMLAAFQLAAHVLFAYLVFTSPELLGWSLLIYFFTGCFGMTMTYHRGLSHRSWNMPKWFEVVGSVLGTYGLTGSTIGWVAAHRKHHRFTDEAGDPHSPLLSSSWRIHFLSMFEPVNVRYAKHLLRSKLHQTLHNYYFHIHLFAIGLLYLAGGVTAVAAFWAAPAVILWHAGSAVNSLNHLSGYRNFRTKDNSHNNPVTGYLVFGEGWHNNHHHKPNSASFAEKWWELDVGHWFITLIRKG